MLEAVKCRRTVYGVTWELAVGITPQNNNACLLANHFFCQ
jgi:hypothetical protein